MSICRELSHFQKWTRTRSCELQLCLLSRSLLGVKRTCLFALHMSAFDPKRTSAGHSSTKLNRHGPGFYGPLPGLSTRQSGDGFDHHRTFRCCPRACFHHAPAHQTDLSVNSIHWFSDRRACRPPLRWGVIFVPDSPNSISAASA